MSGFRLSFDLENRYVPAQLIVTDIDDRTVRVSLSENDMREIAISLTDALSRLADLMQKGKK